MPSSLSPDPSAGTVYETSTSSDAIVVEGTLSSGQPVQVQNHIQRQIQRFCNATDGFNYPLYTYNGEYYGYRMDASAILKRIVDIA